MRGNRSRSRGRGGHHVCARWPFTGDFGFGPLMLQPESDLAIRA